MRHGLAGTVALPLVEPVLEKEVALVTPPRDPGLPVRSVPAARVSVATELAAVGQDGQREDRGASLHGKGGYR